MNTVYNQLRRRTVGRDCLRRNKVNVLFVTAALPEAISLINRIIPYDSNIYDIYIAQNNSYLLGVFGNYSIAHVHCFDQGSSKKNASSLTVMDAINDIRPKIIVMVGIAFGIDSERQAIGDILVSSYVQNYEVLKITQTHKRKNTINRNDKYEPNVPIVNLFSNYYEQGMSYTIWPGTILSGEKLIDNMDYRNELLSYFADDNIVGGEMEGVGLAVASARKENGSWILIKAICDWADGNKSERKEERQILAANNSVDFCYRLFAKEMITSLGIKSYDRPRIRSLFHDSPKIVIFNFDGTITKKNNYSIWQQIWIKLGYDVRECDDLQRSYISGEISHMSWCEATTEKFRNRHLSKSILDEIVQCNQLLIDLPEAIKLFLSKDTLLYICSGSIDYIIHSLLGDLENKFENIQCNQFIFDIDDYFTKIRATLYDDEGKAAYVEQIARVNRVNPSSCLFAGGSHNDLFVRKTGAKTLAINPTVSYYNKDEWSDYILNVESLLKVYEHIFNDKV